MNGYKKTVVGMIPDDWEVKPIGDLVSISVGRDLKIENYSTYQDDTYKYPVFSNTVANEGLYGFYNIYEYSGDSLTVVGRGIGLGTAFKRSGEYGAIGRLLVLFPVPRVDADFLTEYINGKVRIFTESGGIPQLTGLSIAQYRIPLRPTLAEQEAIAEAMSNSDALIESLERLIAKKRHLKQGAMQKLLTPQDGWIERRLGSTATLKARIGWQGLTTAEYLETGDYFLVTGTDFEGGYIDWDHCPYVEESRYKQDQNIQLRQHDVLVTKDGTIGKVALVKHLDKPATLNSGVFVIRPIENSFHPDFLYYLLCSSVFSAFLAQLSAGSTINHLYQKDFVTFNFKTPDTLAEQAVIAAILSDMDTEITALETKLTKSRALKQGMMHKLLTGQIRLI